MQGRRHLDLSLPLDGYLVGADGRIRRVVGLETIARDTLREGVSVEWRTPPGGGAGCSYCWSRHILLAPWLFDADTWRIRDVWTHELGHCLVGPSHEGAKRWQCSRYGDILLPTAQSG